MVVPFVVTVPLVPCVIESMVSGSSSISLFRTGIMTGMFSGVVAVSFMALGISLIGLTVTVTLAKLLILSPSDAL